MVSLSPDFIVCECIREERGSVAISAGRNEQQLESDKNINSVKKIVLFDAPVHR